MAGLSLFRAIPGNLSELHRSQFAQSSATAVALKRLATQSGGLEGILPGVAALPLRGVSLPTATRFIAVDTGSSRSGGWWRGGEATVGVVPDVALVSGAAVSLHCELLG